LIICVKASDWDVQLVEQWLHQQEGIMDKSHHQHEQKDSNDDIDQPTPAPLPQYPQEEEITSNGTAQQAYPHKGPFIGPFVKTFRTLPRCIRRRYLIIESLDNLSFWRPSRHPSSQTISNILLVLFTAGLFGTAFLQWRALDATLEETRKMVRIAQNANTLTREIQTRAERPLIGVDHIDFVNYVPGMRMGAEVSMINAGRTPARITHQDIHIGIVEGDIPSEPPQAKKILPLPYKKHILYKSQGIILPSQTLRSRVLFEEPLPIEIFNNLMSGIASFVVWGNMTYIDRIENSYTMEFCGVYNSKLDDPPTSVSPLVWCTTGSSIP